MSPRPSNGVAEIPLIFESGREGRANRYLEEGKPLESFLPRAVLRDDLPLPDNSELDVVRHFTRLSQRTFGIDLGFYPLGSCTMKYNPRVNDAIVARREFARASSVHARRARPGRAHRDVRARTFAEFALRDGGFLVEPVGGRARRAGCAADREEILQRARRDASRSRHRSRHRTRHESGLRSDVRLQSRFVAEQRARSRQRRRNSQGARGRYGGLHDDQSEHARPLRGRNRADRRGGARSGRPDVLRRCQRQRDHGYTRVPETWASISCI